MRMTTADRDCGAGCAYSLDLTKVDGNPWQRLPGAPIYQLPQLLLQGPAGETPAPGRHWYTTALENAPAYVDLAWRPYRPELPVQIVADPSLFGRTG